MLLAEQDRTLWDSEQIASGRRLVERALALGGAGPYALQAAIAAEHAPSRYGLAADRLLYDRARGGDPPAVVELNRAVAVAMADGPARGLELIDAIAEQARRLPPAALRAGGPAARLGRDAEAAGFLPSALDLTANPVERSFLEQRLAATLGGLRPIVTKLLQSPFFRYSSRCRCHP